MNAELVSERGFFGINEKISKTHRLLSEDSPLKENELLRELQGGNAPSQSNEL